MNRVETGRRRHGGGQWRERNEREGGTENMCKVEGWWSEGRDRDGIGKIKRCESGRRVMKVREG